MKTFRLIGMALVAMTLSFNLSSCDNDDDDDNFIEVDYSQDLVGMWTCHQANVSAAMEIKADGSVISTGLTDGYYWEDVPGKIEVENNKVKLALDNGQVFEGLLEIIPGEAFVIDDKERGIRLTHHLCKKDLSEDIVGMWVCADTQSGQEEYDDTMILTFNDDNTFYFTGYFYAANGYSVNAPSSYKVIGDLLIHIMPEEVLEYGLPRYSALRLTYIPDATAYGDMMTLGYSLISGDKVIESALPLLRVKQHLELPTAKYNYKSTYISNAKGEGTINIDGYNFDFSKMDGVTVDKLFKTLLYTLEFPTTDSLTYSYTLNGTTYTSTVPVTIEGNKMTVHMNKTEGLYRDMDLHVFQDKDNTQMHIYMPKSAFINFFGNTALSFAAKNGQIDPTNADAVNGLFDLIASHVTSINASFVLTK